MSFDTDSFFSGLAVGRSMKGWGTIIKGLPISKTKADISYVKHAKKTIDHVTVAWTITPEGGLITPAVLAATLVPVGRKEINAGTVTGTITPESGLISVSVPSVSLEVEGRKQINAGTATGTLAPESDLISIAITSFRFAKDE